jgi:hypothetical protein
MNTIITFENLKTRNNENEIVILPRDPLCADDLISSDEIPLNEINTKSDLSYLTNKIYSLVQENIKSTFQEEMIKSRIDYYILESLRATQEYYEIQNLINLKNSFGGGKRFTVNHVRRKIFERAQGKKKDELDIHNQNSKEFHFFEFCETHQIIIPHAAIVKLNTEQLRHYYFSDLLLNKTKKEIDDRISKEIHAPFQEKLSSVLTEIPDREKCAPKKFYKEIVKFFCDSLNNDQLINVCIKKYSQHTGKQLSDKYNGPGLEIIEDLLKRLKIDYPSKAQLAKTIQKM